MDAAPDIHRAKLALMAGSGPSLDGYTREVHYSEETGLLAVFSKRDDRMHDEGDTPAFRAYELATGRLMYEINYRNGKQVPSKRPFSYRYARMGST